MTVVRDPSRSPQDLTIVERLRKTVTQGLPDRNIIWEAADEIERLRKALDDCAQARGDWKKSCEAENQVEIEQLHTEIERLRTIIESAVRAQTASVRGEDNA
jgi:HAMP domain-containing protein